MDSDPTPQAAQDRSAVIALACGVLAVLAGILVFWLVLPAVLLGVAAIVFGIRVRRNAGSEIRSREFAAAAIALGIVAMLYVPAGYMISEGGEDYGRDCVLEKNDDC